MDDAAETDRYEAAQAELDRLLNDPDADFDPGRVWALLAELTAHDLPAAQGE
jgi:hypothetical protein